MKNLIFFTLIYISFLIAQENQLFEIKVDKGKSTISFVKKNSNIEIKYIKKYEMPDKITIDNEKSIEIPYQLFLEFTKEFFNKTSKLILQIDDQTIQIDQENIMLFQYFNNAFRLYNTKRVQEIKTINIFHKPFQNKILIKNEDGYPGKLLLNGKKIEIVQPVLLELWKGNYSFQIESSDYIVKPDSIKVEKEAAEHTITIMKPKKEYTIKIEKPDGFAETIFLEKQNKKIPLNNQQKVFLEKGEYTVNIEAKSHYIENPIIHINYTEKQIIEIKINKRLVEGEGIPPYWQEEKYCYWNYPYWQ